MPSSARRNARRLARELNGQQHHQDERYHRYDEESVVPVEIEEGRKRADQRPQYGSDASHAKRPPEPGGAEVKRVRTACRAVDRIQRAGAAETGSDDENDRLGGAGLGKGEN